MNVTGAVIGRYGTTEYYAGLTAADIGREVEREVSEPSAV